MVPGDVTRSHLVWVFIPEKDLEGGAYGKGAKGPWVEGVALLYCDSLHPLVSEERRCGEATGGE